jgi:hypothetical protein
LYAKIQALFDSACDIRGSKMARGKERLTALQVKNAKPAPTPSGMRLLGDGDGLYLQVNRSGKSWLYRWMDDGVPKAMGLGPCPPVSLADARAADRCVEYPKRLPAAT